MSILSRAEEVLHERGWGRSDLFNQENGTVCLLGALAVAYELPLEDDDDGEKAYEFLNETSEVKILEKLILELYGHTQSESVATVWRFNDDEQHTLDDVISIVRKADQRMGNIGEPVKTVEFEPMPETVPVVEPAAPAPAPVEEPVPA